MLCVEDDLTWSNAIRETLQAAGFLVYWAGDITTARELLEMVDIDLITLDMNLPGSPLPDTLAILPEFARAAPVVVCTASGNIDFVRDAIRAGAKRYVAKGCDFHAPLLDACQAALQETRFLERAAGC